MGSSPKNISISKQDGVTLTRGPPTSQPSISADTTPFPLSTPTLPPCNSSEGDGKGEGIKSDKVTRFPPLTTIDHPEQKETMTTPKESRLGAGIVSDSAGTNLALTSSFLKQTKSNTSPLLETTCRNKQGNPQDLQTIPPTSKLESPRLRGTIATSSLAKSVGTRHLEAPPRTDDLWQA
jgi:hypothetical protein